MIHDVLLKPFLFNFKLDDKIKDLLKQIISHNLFVPQEDVKIVYDSIILCFNKFFSVLPHI